MYQRRVVRFHDLRIACSVGGMLHEKLLRKSFTRLPLRLCYFSDRPSFQERCVEYADESSDEFRSECIFLDTFSREAGFLQKGTQLLIRPAHGSEEPAVSFLRGKACPGSAFLVAQVGIDRRCGFRSEEFVDIRIKLLRPMCARHGIGIS